MYLVIPCNVRPENILTTRQPQPISYRRPTTSTHIESGELYAYTPRRQGRQSFSLMLMVMIIVADLAFKTRNSSGDEIANVNFLCDVDIVHAL